MKSLFERDVKVSVALWIFLLVGMLVIGFGIGWAVGCLQC